MPRTRWALVAIAIGVWAVLVFAMVTDAHAATPPVPPSVVAAKTDPQGPQPSAYTGKYYRAADEGYRLCIFARESNSNLRSTGRNGYYQGGYQFTQALARGAAWEMAPELRALWPKHWRVIRNLLIETPMSRWSRWYQDAAFYTIQNVDGVHEGAPHWAGGRWACWPGMRWTR